MSESRTLLTDTADRLFADVAANPDAPFAEAWPAIAEAGFESLLLSEEEGGFGGDWGDLFAVARLAGSHALAAPVGEAAVAAWALARAGLAPSDGLATIAPVVEGRIEGGRFTGSLRGAPWGGAAETVVATYAGSLLRLRTADAQVQSGHSPVGEPRDVLTFEAAAVQAAPATSTFSPAAPSSGRLRSPARWTRRWPPRSPTPTTGCSSASRSASSRPSSRAWRSSRSRPPR
jgi:acyl-CoA dehydrogenase